MFYYVLRLIFKEFFFKRIFCSKSIFTIFIFISTLASISVSADEGQNEDSSVSDNPWAGVQVPWKPESGSSESVVVIPSFLGASDDGSSIVFSIPGGAHMGIGNLLSGDGRYNPVFQIMRRCALTKSTTETCVHDVDIENGFVVLNRLPHVSGWRCYPRKRGVYCKIKF